MDSLKELRATGQGETQQAIALGRETEAQLKVRGRGQSCVIMVELPHCNHSNELEVKACYISTQSPGGTYIL